MKLRLHSFMSIFSQVIIRIIFILPGLIWITMKRLSSDLVVVMVFIQALLVVMLCLNIWLIMMHHSDTFIIWLLIAQVLLT